MRGEAGSAPAAAWTSTSPEEPNSVNVGEKRSLPLQINAAFLLGMVSCSLLA